MNLTLVRYARFPLCLFAFFAIGVALSASSASRQVDACANGWHNVLAEEIAGSAHVGTTGCCSQSMWMRFDDGEISGLTYDTYGDSFSLFQYATVLHPSDGWDLETGCQQSSPACYDSGDKPSSLVAAVSGPSDEYLSFGIWNQIEEDECVADFGDWPP